MNAPLPADVARQAQVYDKVARAGNEVAGRLAANLASQTQGEVLFSAADRGVLAAVVG